MIPSCPTEIQEKTFEGDAVPINYAEGQPNGPPIVLLHGLGRNWQDFLVLIPELSKQWQVYAVDLRGHGKSGRAPRAYTSSGYTADIVLLLKQVICRKAILFGHSLGGVVATRVAAQHGNHVSALVLGDSVLSRETLPHSLYATLFSGLYHVALQGGSIQEMAARLAKIEIPVPDLDQVIALGEFPGNDDGYFRRWADCLRQVDPEAFAMTLDGSCLADFDTVDLLPHIQCPTLLLQASPDLGGLMSDNEISSAMRLLPQARLVRFPLLGHALHLQRAEPVLEAVLGFLTSI